MTAFEYKIDEATYAGIPGASELMGALYKLQCELHKKTYEEVIDALVLREQRKERNKPRPAKTRLWLLLYYREHNQFPKCRMRPRKGNLASKILDVRHILGITEWS